MCDVLSSSISAMGILPFDERGDPHNELQISIQFSARVSTVVRGNSGREIQAHCGVKIERPTKRLKSIYYYSSFFSLSLQVQISLISFSTQNSL